MFTRLSHTLLMVLALHTFFLSVASGGSRPSCEEDPESLVWFVQMGDTHIGASPGADDALETFVETTVPILSPSFVINVGDLTDATNGGLLPTGPFLTEWLTYQRITSGLDPMQYIDLAGNHDHYNDPDFHHYLTYSVTGAGLGSTCASWSRNAGGFRYHFLGLCTAGNDGAPFSLFQANYGDHASLDAKELDMAETELAAHVDAQATLVFGHHAVDAWGTTGNDSLLTYGGDALKELMARFDATCYGYGHTHDQLQAVHPQGVLLMNTPAFSESQTYALMALDGGGLSATYAVSGSWPVVLITAPLGLTWGTGAHTKAYAVSESGPLRALVFDTSPPESVGYRINATGPWRPMDPVNPGAPVWQAIWEADDAHTIEVRAQGSSTKVARVIIGTRPSQPLATDPENPGPTDASPPEPVPPGASESGCFLAVAGE